MEEVIQRLIKRCTIDREQAEAVAGIFKKSFQEARNDGCPMEYLEQLLMKDLRLESDFIHEFLA